MADTPGSSTTETPSSGSSSRSGTFGFLTRKIGPLPVWVYAVVIVGAYYWYEHYGPGASKKKQGQGSGQGQGQGAGGGAGTVLLVGRGGGGREVIREIIRPRRGRPRPRPGPGPGHHRPRPRRFPGGQVPPVHRFPGGRLPNPRTLPGGRIPGVDPGGPMSGTTAYDEVAAPPYITPAGQTPGDTTGVASEPQQGATAADLGAAPRSEPGGRDQENDRDRDDRGRGQGQQEQSFRLVRGGYGLAGDAGQPGGAASIYAPYDGRSQWKSATGWEAAAINYLIGEGIAPEEASTSVWTYLHGEPQSARMQADAQLAVDGIGPPPDLRKPTTVKKRTPARNSRRPGGRGGVRVVRV